VSSSLPTVLLVLTLVSALLLGWLAWRPRRTDPPPTQVSPADASPAGPPEPANQLSTADSEPVVTIVLRLSDALERLGDKSSHPREMPHWPEFQQAVAAFARPDAPIELLHQYACGANWPLACAALAALPQHPEGASLAGVVLSQLGNIRPWSLHFALLYLAALDQRPPVGAVLVAAPAWWADNLVIPGLFQDYLAAREARGDLPDFGDALGSPRLESPDAVTALLKRIDHPFAATLLGQLETWQSQRLDRTFLATIGRFWNAGDDETLLVEPAAWREAIEQGQSAVLHNPPRSIVVSGEVRVGKTSFLRLLGARLQGAGWTIFEASGADLMAGQVYIGELEGRIRRLVAELDVRKRVAWYVGDVLQLAESGTHRGQAASILDQIVPAIAAGRLVILGETSPAGATRLFQLRPSLRSLVEAARLDPMSEEAAASLAGEVAARLREQLHLTIADDAIVVALQLAQQYLGSGQLPGALIELIKRAAQRALAAGDGALTPESVLSTLSQVTGLPRSILDDNQRIELSTVKQFFAERVMGQVEAVDGVVDRIAMLKAGLVDPGRPIGVFLFAGPTGTGKTELAKTLAEFLFGSPERMARLDMSEFQSPEATSKILGQRGDAVLGDSLAERIRKEPFSVVLLDEFEKAHANVWDLFLQMFDDGRLTDANGRSVDFRHTLIILTSNLGATGHRSSGLGFMPETGVYTGTEVMRSIEQTFRPEFVNRLDKIIVFRPLSRALMRNILQKELKGVLERRGLRRRDWAVEWESSALDFLLDRGFTPEMGARPLKRAIDQHLLAPLAATLVEHRFPTGRQFLFVRSNGRAIEVEFVDPDAGASAEEADAAVETDGTATLALADLILRPHGTPGERTVLTAAWHDIQDQLASVAWTTLRSQLQAEAGAADIWSRADRHVVFARVALIDRVEEAARTAERLRERLDGGSPGRGQGGRELIARLALQFHVLRDGIMDVLIGAPVDVLVAIEPALIGGADNAVQTDWCERLRDMYRRWATLRRMQIAEVAAPRGGGAPILQIGGFGAFRALEAEAGLHVFEASDDDGGRRVVARVKAAAGPWQEPGPAEAYRRFVELTGAAPASTTVIRRYRGGTAPLVRDARTGWRSGRLDDVMAGNFDLIGALQR
jgi:ATP-dependent Clp protease ATP-binding subunit ClpC